MRLAILGSSLVLVSFVYVYICGLPEFLSELTITRAFVETLAATCIGAWAGGAAAFRTERTTREKAERTTHIAAANKAIFKLSVMFHFMENIRESYIDKDNMRRNPQRAVKMDSPQSGMVTPLHFNLDELAYLLDERGEKGGNALMKLTELDLRFHVALTTIELRAKAREDLEIAKQAHHVENATIYDKIFSAEYGRLSAATEQLISGVDDGLAEAREAYADFCSALLEHFPRESFVEVRFPENPKTGGSARGVQ
jgi:hypothetical protein